jgi:hypothetical protein
MMSASLPSALPLPLPGPIIPPPPLLLGKISGVKFNDLNANGVRDAGEPGLANWRIYIDRNLNGHFDVGERSALTNVFGQYSINNLAPGTYRVREVQQPGWRQTAPSPLGYHTVVLPLFGSASNRNFGNTRTVRISGTVYNDANANHVRNVGEGGLAGFKVYLDSNNNGAFDAGERNVTTGVSGTYVFNALPPGFYHVRVAPRLFYTQTAPVGGAYHQFLFSGTTIGGRDFGEKFNPIVVGPPIPIPFPKIPPIPLPIPFPPLPGPGPVIKL